MKNSWKEEHSTEDIEVKLLDKQEENRYIISHSEYLQEQLKKSEDDRKSHVEVIKKFQNDNMQLQNKLEKIQNETLKPQETKIQLSAQINAKKMTLVKGNDIVKIHINTPTIKTNILKSGKCRKIEVPM